LAIKVVTKVLAYPAAGLINRLMSWDNSFKLVGWLSP
jgi:hypothetical protein